MEINELDALLRFIGLGILELILVTDLLIPSSRQRRWETDYHALISGFEVRGLGECIGLTLMRIFVGELHA